MGITIISLRKAHFSHFTCVSPPTKRGEIRSGYATPADSVVLNERRNQK